MSAPRSSRAGRAALFGALALLALQGCNRHYQFDWEDFDGGVDDMVTTAEGSTDAPLADAPLDAPPTPDAGDASAPPDGPPSDVPMLPDAGPLDPPRLLFPLSVSMLTTNTPRLRWEMHAGDGVRVELCRVAGCATVDRTFDTTGTEFVVPAALTAGVWFWRVRPRMGMGYGTSTSAVWEFTIGRHNTTVATVSAMVQGDFNGDGYADIAVGGLPFLAPSSVTIYNGSASGTPTAVITIQAPTGSPEQFGISVAKVGDVNRDGFGDLVVGAPSNMAAVAGRAYVYYGSAVGLSNMPSATLTGFAGGDRFGQTVAPAGDVNGDGFADVVVTAPQASGGAGRVYVYLGGMGGLAAAPAATLSPPATVANFGDARAAAGADFAGSPASSAGDVDGDGLSDLVVGAPSTDGSAVSAFVFYRGTTAGATGVETTGRVVQRPSDLVGSRFGVTVVALGDFDGDGYGDVGVGAAGNMSTGASRAMYFRGPMLAGANTVITGTSADRAGAAMAGYADVDGNGLADFAIGIPGSTGASGPANTGRASFHVGRSPTPLPIITLNSPQPTVAGGYGSSISNVGDVNGDGRSDFVIGMPLYNMGGELGRAYLHLGTMGSLTASGMLLPRGASANGFVGFTVASARRRPARAPRCDARIRGGGAPRS